MAKRPRKRARVRLSEPPHHAEKRCHRRRVRVSVPPWHAARSPSTRGGQTNQRSHTQTTHTQTIAQGCHTYACRRSTEKQARSKRLRGKIFFLLVLRQLAGELSPSIILPQASPAHHRSLLLGISTYLLVCRTRLRVVDPSSQACSIGIETKVERGRKSQETSRKKNNKLYLRHTGGGGGVVCWVTFRVHPFL